jgi:hypothetical protein
MIDPERTLPIQKQAKVLQISRSTVYYQPRPISDDDLFLMRRIDKLHLDYPFAGSRMLRGLLWQQGGGRSQAHKNADEKDGNRGHISQSEYFEARSGAQNLPVFIEEYCSLASQPSLGYGYHLYPNGAWLRLSGRSSGLVQPPRSSLEVVDHNGYFVLHRSARRGPFHE